MSPYGGYGKYGYGYGRYGYGRYGYGRYGYGYAAYNSSAAYAHYADEDEGVSDTTKGDSAAPSRSWRRRLQSRRRQIMRWIDS